LVLTCKKRWSSSKAHISEDFGFKWCVACAINQS